MLCRPCWWQRLSVLINSCGGISFVIANELTEGLWSDSGAHRFTVIDFVAMLQWYLEHVNTDAQTVGKAAIAQILLKFKPASHKDESAFPSATLSCFSDGFLSCVQWRHLVILYSYSLVSRPTIWNTSISNVFFPSHYIHSHTLVCYNLFSRRGKATHWIDVLKHVWRQMNFSVLPKVVSQWLTLFSDLCFLPVAFWAFFCFMPFLARI